MAVCYGFTHQHGSAWTLCCLDSRSPRSSIRCSLEPMMSPYLPSHLKQLTNSTLMFALIALGGAGGSKKLLSHWRKLVKDFSCIKFASADYGIPPLSSSSNKGREQSFPPYIPACSPSGGPYKYRYPPFLYDLTLDPHMPQISVESAITYAAEATVLNHKMPSRAGQQNNEY